MPLDATVYRVLIATPSDIKERGDRAAVREAIMDWNAAGPMGETVFLEPVMYETHVAKDIGKPPQQIINEQILDEVDLAVGLFWTRVGTATENAEGGAVEEIKTVAKNRPVILGFSQAPVEREQLDPRQFSQVKELEDEFRDEGLYFSYREQNELKNILRQELTNTMDRLVGGGFRTKEKLEEDSSEYDVDVDHERLQLSARVHREQDMANIDRALEHLEDSHLEPPYDVLDAGCGYGTVTKSRFGEDERFRVHGIDIAASAIGVAREEYAADNISYQILDVTDLPDADIGSFDLVFSSYLFHHLDRGAQESVLSILWNHVRPSGVLMIRSCDDGQHLHFPPDDDMDWFVEVTDEIKGSSDRTHGRRLYTHQCRLRPEPAEIELDLHNYHTAGCSRDEREEYWDVFHSNRVHYAEVLANRPEATKADRELRNRMEREYTRLEEKFKDNPNFLDTKSVPMTVAYRPG